jgi:DNA-binding response OmpR family regulator
MSPLPDILLVEDSATQARSFQLLLEREGYHVSIAGDGAAGWHFARVAAPRLILLDVDLPIFDGFQLLSRLKRDRHTCAIPVIMLTHREHISQVERAIALGAADYLFKDDAVQMLCTVVQPFLATTVPSRPPTGGVHP